MPKVTIEQLKHILEAGCLSVPHVYSDNRQDEPYARGHKLAVDQILEIINDGWHGGNTPRLRFEVTRKDRCFLGWGHTGPCMPKSKVRK